MVLPGDFLFLDESGDLGCGPRSSSHLVVTVLHLAAASALSRTIRRARLKTAGRSAHRDELKWSTSSEKVKLAVFNEIVREAPLIRGVSAGVAVKTPPITPDGLYHLAARRAFEAGHLLDTALQHRRLRLTIDGRQSMAVIQKLVSAEVPCACTLVTEDSERSPQLQVVDFIAGAVFHMMTKSDPRFVDTLREAGVLVRILGE